MTQYTMPQRASKTSKKIKLIDRNQARASAMLDYQQGRLTQGQLLKKMRIEILGLTQIQFTKLAKVSRKTLSDIENDRGNYSIATVNQVFRPFQLQLTLDYIM